MVTIDTLKGKCEGGYIPVCPPSIVYNREAMQEIPGSLSGSRLFVKMTERIPWLGCI